MADNVAITAGSGTDVATDQVTGTLEHVQLFKLAYSADGSRTLVTADANGLLVDLGGNNDVTVTSGTVSLGAAIPAGTNNIGDVDVLTVPAPLSTTGGGTEATALRVTIASDSTGVVSIDDNGGAITVDNGGTFAVQAAQSGTWTVQPGNTANTTPWLVTQTPGTTGGLTTYHLVSAASQNATNIKASAGQVFGWYIYNNNSSARKVAFHNTAGTPTAGASIFFSLVIPGSSGANVAFPNGIAFSTGIAITTVTEVTDAGSTAVALNDLIINIFYK